MSQDLLITPIPAFEDNYLWLLHRPHGDRAVVVDPGDADAVTRTLEYQGLSLSAILVTHHHWDHIHGIEALKSRYRACVYGPAEEDIPGRHHPLADGDRVRLQELDAGLEVIGTPGHTRGHITYYGEGALFCGDTLFAGGCGRLFEGSAAQLHDSLKCLASLPGTTRIYCAHEYTQANLRFAIEVDADNADLQQRIEQVARLRAQDLPSLPSTLAEECRTNPFLRCADTHVRAAVERHVGHPLTSELEVFTELRRWKDRF